MPPALWHLKYNPQSGFYEILEDGITYKMQLEETRSLKDYFRDFRTESGTKFPSIEGWFNVLPKLAKKRVIREGNIKPPEYNGFYPDFTQE